MEVLRKKDADHVSQVENQEEKDLDPRDQRHL
jgi:hypothetical protein